MSTFLRYFSCSGKDRILSTYRRYSKQNFKPFYESLFEHSQNVAVYDTHGAYKYNDILSASYLIAQKIKKILPAQSGERVSFLCTSDATYVSVFLACWITGNAAVPLCPSHPAAMLEYYVENSESKLVIANEKYIDPMQNIATKLKSSFLCVDRDVFASTSSVSKSDLLKSEFFSWDSSFQNKRALIIYTSGTTGRPKGVVLTHGNLFSQISAVVKSWEIDSKDSILLSLPLHHIHGIMNGFLCPLRSGGTLVMQPKFDAPEAWKYFLNLDSTKPRVNLFFAVPTMYAKLLQEYNNSGYNESSSRDKCLKTMRLMSSGSSSLPVPVFQRWESITGHTLLERFGMSEIGMATSNPLRGLRMPGSVGNPLPEVEVKIVKPGEASESSDLVIGNDKEVKIQPGCEGKSGELMIRGPNVFNEYYNRPEATAESFTKDGWFQTGDTACYEKGGFKILGRTSVDIIKSGGYKISALEVESCLLRHPDIKECTVLGIDDDVWGERVAAVLMFNEGKHIANDELRAWCKSYIAGYAVPTVIKNVKEIPRNVMGKVNKKELRKVFDSL
ncbi:malonate--CoA ligase ACSF3, mitochondrial [Parasteatoda tepidariorum]|nr:malonate--CoA ligase ACSF3, mitochondrial [Parasteatoda tepidariorum]